MATARLVLRHSTLSTSGATSHAAAAGLLHAKRRVGFALQAPAAHRAAAVLPVRCAGYQQQLTNQQRKAKRAEAQRLGRQLCTVNLGAKGLTPAFIDGFRAALAGNELVKVKVGACDESAEEIVELLSQAGDCVLVHKIGFTLTFYRDKSLPPPPPYKPRRSAQRQAAASVAGGAAAGEEGQEQAGSSDAEEEEEESDDELSPEVLAYLESEDAFSDSDSEGEEEEEEEDSRPNSSRRQAAAARAAQAGRPPPPPEFVVISPPPAKGS